MSDDPPAPAPMARPAPPAAGLRRALLALALALLVVDLTIFPLSARSPLRLRQDGWTAVQRLAFAVGAQRQQFADYTAAWEEASAGRGADAATSPPPLAIPAPAGSPPARPVPFPYRDVHRLPLLPLATPAWLLVDLPGFEAGWQLLGLPASRWPVLELPGQPALQSFGLVARIAALGRDRAAAREWRDITGRLAALPRWRLLAAAACPLLAGALFLALRRWVPPPRPGLDLLLTLAVLAWLAWPAAPPPPAAFAPDADVAWCDAAMRADLRHQYRDLLGPLAARGALASSTVALLATALSAEGAD